MPHIVRKAILTGGGRATRLRPITTTINKHLLPVGGIPMIVRAIEQVRRAGITDIFINTNPGETALQNYLGDGHRFGVHLTFFEQQGGPQGIAHVVHEAKQFIGDDPFLFYLSDNLFVRGIEDMVRAFSEGEYDCMLALAKVPDPERFGVPLFDPNGTLVQVLEKPSTPPSPFAVTGAYLYGPNVFFETYPTIRKSARGEYEISDIHSQLLTEGKNVGYVELTGWWKDTGKLDDLLLANELLLDTLSVLDISPDVRIHETATISGIVHLGKGVAIGPNTTLIGPLILGDNTQVEEAVIGPYVTTGRDAVLHGCTLSQSLLLDRVNIQTQRTIDHRLVGNDTTITTESTGTISGIFGDCTKLTV